VIGTEFGKGRASLPGFYLLQFTSMLNQPSDLIEFQDVSYSVASAEILRGLTFTVVSGEILILLGESGCGKTTTLKLINRLIEPTHGTVLVEGRSTLEWDPIELRRSVGYVLQDGVTRMKERTRGLLDLVGLDPQKFSDRYPHELSGGQRQRVGVARALAADPKILLLDEPFGALDAITRTNLQKEFAKLVRELGKTAVFVTHDLHEALLLGSRIALMDRGRIVLAETPENFLRSELDLARKYLDTISY
jgi:osmoprotectant transport system ATP-binding protein